MKMNIPSKYQVFDGDPTPISDKDFERLSPYLSGWPKLNTLFVEGIGEQEIKQLIILEMMDRRRAPIIDRLVMRLGRLQRVRLRRQISKTVLLVNPTPYGERGQSDK
jgi:hypothetical protein